MAGRAFSGFSGVGHMDLPGMRRGGVRAAADRRLPGSRRCRRGVLSGPSAAGRLPP
jgi:hypothetical protein